MDRVTLRVPKAQIDELDELVDSGEFPNRSEAIRAAIRHELNGHQNRERPPRKV